MKIVAALQHKFISHVLGFWFSCFILKIHPHVSSCGFPLPVFVLFPSFFLCFIFSLALVSLCVLCAAALLSVAPGLSSVLFNFVLGLCFACLLLFAFWILNSVAHHQSSLHVVTSCLPLCAIHHVCKPKQSQHVKL